MHVPLVTPFYPDGRVYLRKLEHNVDRVSRTPAAGMVVLGSLGEPGSLSDDETREVLAVAAGAAAREKVLIAGIAREGVREALRLADHAANCGYDAVLLRTPRAWPMQMHRAGSAEMLTFFRAVADQSPLPVVVENTPKLSGYDLPVETIAALAEHGNVIGLAEASEAEGKIATVLKATAGISRGVTVTTVFAAVTGRMLQPEAAAAGGAMLVPAETLSGGAAVAVAALAAKPALKTRVKLVGFQVLAAGAVDCFAALRSGAAGMMPSLAACAPQACHEVLATWKDGDAALAEEKYARVRAAAVRMEELGLGALKFGCDLNGYFGGRPRLPLLPASGVEQAEIATLLQEIRN